MNNEGYLESQDLAEEKLQELQRRNELNNIANINKQNVRRPSANFSNRLNNIRNNSSLPSLTNNQNSVINDANINSKNNATNSKNGNVNTDSNNNGISGNSRGTQNSSLAKSNGGINKNSNMRSKAGNVAQNALSKYLKAKGVPEWATKLALNKNRSRGLPGIPRLGASKQNLLNPFGNMFGQRRETETLENEKSIVNIGLSIKLIKTIGIITPFVFLFFCVFICLFVGTQTYINAKKLQHAYSSEKLEDYMNENITQDEIDDLENESGFYFIDYTESNYVTVASKVQKYKTAEMEELKDYYSYVNSYGSDVDEDVVYKFFFKLDFIKKYYKSNYHVELDIPLLMSTLILQSDDMNVVFKKNTKGFGYKICRSKNGDKYDYSPCWDKNKIYARNYDYNNDWSSYKISYSNSQHDIEILAQHMISYQATETCRNSSNNIVSTNILRDDEIGTQVLSCNEGETYSVTGASYNLDEEKYKEFLKEFIEKKYYLDKDSNRNDDEDDDSDTPSGDSVSANFTKYTFEGDLLEQIASVCYREQGSAKGAAAEASLIANKFEYSSDAQGYQEKYGKTGTGLYYYLLNSRWWGYPLSDMQAKSAPAEVVEAVRSVLVEGKRTLPRYIDEHDCWDCNSSNRCSDGKRGDICTLNTDGRIQTSMSAIRKRSNYVKNETLVKNVYGSDYTFYSFPTSDSDPFGYISEKLRQTVGECYYDYDSNRFMNCGTSFVSTFISWLKSIAQDDSHGYSQVHRESLIDFDCASLVYFGLINSGFNTEQLGTNVFTVSGEGKVLKQVGFEEIRFSSLVPDGTTTTNLEPGDILVAESHTEVYIGEGLNIGAHVSETGGITGEYGDQTGREISITNYWNDNWLYVYRYRG